MPARKIILIVIASLIAMITIMLTRGMMANKPDGAPAPEAKPVAEIIVAARDLPSGTLVKDGDLKWQQWPKEAAETGSFAVKGKADLPEYVGSVVRNGLRTGEPVQPGRIVKKSDQGFMAAVLNPGMRAVTIAITPITGVAGFIFPGDRVDVIVTHTLSRRNGTGENSQNDERHVSETALRDVRVLALDQKSDDQVKDPKPAQTVTLEVSPKQAEQLMLASQLGTLSLALRSLGSDPVTADNDLAGQLATSGTDGDNLTWDSDVSSVLPKPGNRHGRLHHIQIMRGKESSEATFDWRQ
jgi:pilus assembly protein CpaB